MLKTLLGDAYKDDMTLEEIEKALQGRELVDKGELPKSVSKDVFDKTASELAKYKRELETLRAENLSSEEKLQLEVEKAQKIQTEFTRELSKLQAKDVFVTAGLKEEQYGSLIEMVTGDDPEVTKRQAEAITSLLAAQRDEVEKSTRSKVLNETPAPEPGAVGADFDKEMEAAREAKDYVALAALIRQKGGGQG